MFCVSFRLWKHPVPICFSLKAEGIPPFTYLRQILVVKVSPSVPTSILPSIPPSQEASHLCVCFALQKTIINVHCTRSKLSKLYISRGISFRNHALFLFEAFAPFALEPFLQRNAYPRDKQSSFIAKVLSFLNALPISEVSSHLTPQTIARPCGLWAT